MLGQYNTTGMKSISQDQLYPVTLVKFGTAGLYCRCISLIYRIMLWGHELILSWLVAPESACCAMPTQKRRSAVLAYTVFPHALPDCVCVHALAIAGVPAH